MYTRENSSPLVECSVSRFTRSGATSMPSDVDSATRSSRRSMLAARVADASPSISALRRIRLGAQARHEGLASESLNHLIEWWRRSPCTLPLHRVELECVAISAQRVEFREIQEHVPLAAPRSPA